MYTANDRELLGLISFLNRFRCYLEGTELISLRLMLDSGADGIPGWIDTSRLPSLDLQEGGSVSHTLSRSRSRSLLKSRDRSQRLVSNADQVVAWFLYFYRMVATIVLHRLGPSLLTELG